MDKIKIKKSPTADTRSAKELVTKDQLKVSSEMHIEDVRNAFLWITNELKRIAHLHDWTKIKHIDEFYLDFNNTQKNGADFISLPWYNLHITKERHHIDCRCPEDVNLFDLLERIVDIAVAGMARAGFVFSDNINPEILLKAYANTIELIQSHIVIIEDEEAN